MRALLSISDGIDAVLAFVAKVFGWLFLAYGDRHLFRRRHPEVRVPARTVRHRSRIDAVAGAGMALARGRCS